MNSGVIKFYKAGDTDDLWLAYNMGIAKQYQTETFDTQTKLDALVYPVKPYQGGETIKIETAKRNLEFQIKKYDQDIYQFILFHTFLYKFQCIIIYK